MKRTSSNLKKDKAAVFSVEYDRLFEEIKSNIARSQQRVSIALNRGLVVMYLDIGRRILERQQIHGWGQSVVERLAKDLSKTFPNMKGFSPRNLWDMRRLFESCSNNAILRQAAAEIPWGHNLVLLNTVKDVKERVWYMRKVVEHGWSRAILIHQIESRLYHKKGQALTNFKQILLPPQSELAHQILKDPYNFDFLTLEENAVERDLEQALIKHIQEFLLELGVGFAFVGRQYRVSIGNEDFYIDLLFYHLKLRCYVVIELKTRQFKPEYAGKMSFYLSVIDDKLRHPEDRNTIGIILCKTPDKTIVEYALRDNKKPIGVSSYQLKKMLPTGLKGSLPTVNELEAELKELEDKRK
jgi:predicted nuclease of restriction endonuclease-like (RecB) superfamily